MWKALRSNPTHAADVSLLYALPQLSPHVERWWRTRRKRHPYEDRDVVARRVVMRAAGVARRGGIITGSSLYVGMVPAMAMIYCEQLALVLRIAAVYGRDPLGPARAAEILVIQGRYASVSEAAQALRLVGRPASTSSVTSDSRTMAGAIRQLPTMLGLRVRKISGRSLWDHFVTVVEVASFFVPVMSIPVWAFVNARATRRLGRAAIAFYRPPGEGEMLTDVVLPSRPTRRARLFFMATVVPLVLAIAIAVTLLGKTYKHGLSWVVLGIAEGSLLLIFVRLIRVTRVEAPAAA